MNLFKFNHLLEIQNMKEHTNMDYGLTIGNSKKATLTICTNDFCNLKRLGQKALPELRQLELAAINPVEYENLGHKQSFLKEKEICFKTSQCSKLIYRPIYFWKQRVRHFKG